MTNQHLQDLINKQTGMATSSLILLLVALGLCLHIAFKMVPVYLSNMTVQGSLKSVAMSTPDLHAMRKSEIASKIRKNFSVNSVRDLDVGDAIQVIKLKDKTLINSIYEVRVPLFLNIDVVMKFRNQVDSSNLEGCCKYLIDHVPKK